MTKNVIILGSGASYAKNILKVKSNIRTLCEREPTRVIAVNGAIDFMGDVATDFFTLDASDKNSIRMNNPVFGVQYHWAAQPDKLYYGINGDILVYDRISTNYMLHEKSNTPEYWVKRWGSTLGLQENKSRISSGNSAYGALNLAYHWEPKKIIMLGVDADQEPRQNFEGVPENNLSHLPLLFNSAMKQLITKNIRLMGFGNMRGIWYSKDTNFGEAFLNGYI